MSKLKWLSLGGAMWLVLIGAIAWQAKSCEKRQPVVVVSMSDINEARVKIADLGFHCNFDNAGEIGTGMLVCREKLPPDRVISVSTGTASIFNFPRNHPGMVWVASMKQTEFSMSRSDRSDHFRVWGNVYGIGDAALLDEIEKGIRK